MPRELEIKIKVDKLMTIDEAIELMKTATIGVYKGTTIPLIPDAK